MWLLWCAELVNVLHEQPCGRPVDRLTILDSYEIQNGGHSTVPKEKKMCSTKSPWQIQRIEAAAAAAASIWNFSLLLSLFENEKKNECVLLLCE